MWGNGSSNKETLSVWSQALPLARALTRSVTLVTSLGLMSSPGKWRMFPGFTLTKVLVVAREVVASLSASCKIQPKGGEGSQRREMI